MTVTNDHFVLLLALVRFGGLRCPSELLGLKHGDFDLEKGFFQVKESKTEFRIVPITVEIFKPLANRLATPETPLFPNYQSKHSDGVIRNTLHRACVRVGIRPWEKPFVNMRASCEYDWFRAEHGVDEVTAWMGHSPETALRHYNRARQRMATEDTGNTSNGGFELPTVQDAQNGVGKKDTA